MAAHEEKDQRVVFLRNSFDGLQFWCVDRRKGDVRHLTFATATSRFRANVICHPPEGDLRQPCAGIVRLTLAWPLHRRGKGCLLNGVLGRREVAKSSDNGPEHLRSQFPQQRLEVGRCHWSSSGGPLMICRTSIGMFSGAPPRPGAADARAAT